jgi:uracil-DNA glycosylase family 4
MKEKRKLDFNALVSEVKNCNNCPRMCDRKKVLSEKNGNINSKVIFIAEAPGRLGAERTGIPLHGDQTGNNFEELLNSIGWEREKVFITNAILCNPQSEKGNNASPGKGEINNCSNYLKKTIELVNPDVIVTLGGTALNALKYISNHSFVLRDSVAKEQEWNGKKLFPLYHPGDRAKRYRKKTQQRSDFKALKRLVDPLTGISEKRSQNP